MVSRALSFEKISTSLVLLPSENVTLTLESAELGKFIREPEVSAAGRIISMREQIEIALEPGRIVIQDKSDEGPGKAEFPRIIGRLLDYLAEKGLNQYRAMGWNFDVEFDLGSRPSGILIREKFLQLPRLGETEVMGAGIKLYFQRDAARCTLRLEPRFDRPDSSKVFAHANYHYEIEGRPLDESIESSFLQAYGDFQSIVKQLVGVS